MYLLGYDIGSSSVKASLVNAETGKCVSSAFFPKTEAAIIAVKPGWAEQNPESWWENQSECGSCHPEWSNKTCEYQKSGWNDKDP